jgi:hypothetical protein
VTTADHQGAGAQRESADDSGAAANQDNGEPAARRSDTLTSSGSASGAYSSIDTPTSPAPSGIQDSGTPADVSPAGPSTDHATSWEVPATQAMPAGTLAQVNGPEHSARVQLHTDAMGPVTADLHTRPGEVGVHLSVPDDAGRALMAQRLDALRSSLGQGGTAVHLSLGGQELPDRQGNTSTNDSSTSTTSGTNGTSADGSNPATGDSTDRGADGNLPREGRAASRSDHQPHDAVTPRAMDGSPAKSVLADGGRLVDVRA